MKRFVGSKTNSAGMAVMPSFLRDMSWIVDLSGQIENTFESQDKRAMQRDYAVAMRDLAAAAGKYNGQKKAKAKS